MSSTSNLFSIIWPILWKNSLCFKQTGLAGFTGIYEIFCKEIFGITPKNLEFGLQPYKVPDTDTVRILFDLLMLVSGLAQYI